MSAQPAEVELGNQPPDGDDDQVLVHAPDQVEVRRNASVAGVVGVAASAMAIAYLQRAAGGGSFLDWALCLVLGAIAVTFLRGLLDARLPLLVADEMGVRVRLGSQWRGLPWEAIDNVVVKPRRGLFHDGRLVVTLHHVHRAIEGLEGRARRHAMLNQKMYGAVLAVPLGLTTRVSGAETDDVADRVAALSQGRAEVVTLLDEPGPVLPSSRGRATTVGPADGVEEDRTVIGEDEPVPQDRRPRWLRRDEQRRSGAATTEPATADPAAGVEDEPPAAHQHPEPAADPRREGVSLVIDAMNPVDQPAIAPATSGKVRAIAKLGEPVAPLVIGDFEPEPAYDPVIGPELAAARTRVGLSVDELANRTRIRPHVIESIEVDDFTPCGGDFYARGHIRTLARVLGKDPEPMLEAFEARYATAPVNARRVFEAELATGMTGSMRSTVAGGPNWALLVGVVLSLVLVWSLVRLFAGDSQEMLENPPPVLNGSAGLDNGDYTPPQAAPPVLTALTAANGGAHVTVLDGDGAVVFEGDLALGESTTLRVDPPVTVSSDDGGAVSVAVGGSDQGPVGDAGTAATRVFQRPGG